MINLLSNVRRAVVGASFLAVAVFASAATADKPNVLFIAVDDLRPELGCYGHPMIKSPNIDKLASQGLQFNSAYCQLALCNPSRSSLLSGRRPETLGVFDLKTFLRDKNPDLVTLPELFKKNGYKTIRFGKIFHATNGNHDDRKSWSAGEPSGSPEGPTTAPAKRKPGPEGKGAAKAPAKPQFFDPEGADHTNDLPWESPDVADEALLDGKVAQSAIAAMRANTTGPLFLAVGFHKPHMPFIAPKRYWDMYDHSKIELPPNYTHPKDAPAFASNDSSELRRYKGMPKTGPVVTDDQARDLIHAYYACVSYTDAQIGKVLDELDRLKLRDKTIIILWGDHGYHLGEQGTWNKRTNWEIATRVPMIISYPGQKSRGQKTDAIVEFVDVFPTLASMCGLPLPPKLEGLSLQELLDDPARKWKSAAFSMYRKDIKELGGEADGRAMRTERYRFVEWRATDPNSTQTVCELYDEKSDPLETTNIANKPENAELVKQMSDKLHAGWKAALPE